MNGEILVRSETDIVVRTATPTAEVLATGEERAVAVSQADRSSPLTVVVGTQGLRGAPGKTGETGATGIQGPRGWSAYELAILEGQFVGTFSEWLASLKGEKGWAPALVVRADGARRVLQIVDWYGGEGAKPTAGAYLGDGAWVETIAAALDIRGEQGLQGLQGVTGDQGIQGVKGDSGWAPAFGVTADGERRVLKLVDYVGGSGTKPAVPANTYLGATGYTTTLADAIDVRGAQGPVAANDSITNALLANMPGGTLKGNNSGGMSDPKDLTVAEVNAMLGVDGKLTAASNLGDLANFSLARSNIGLGGFRKGGSFKHATLVPAVAIIFPYDETKPMRRLRIYAKLSYGVIPSSLLMRFTTDAATWKQGVDDYNYQLMTARGTGVYGGIASGSSAEVLAASESQVISGDCVIDISNNQNGQVVAWHSKGIVQNSSSLAVDVRAGYSGWGVPIRGVLLFASGGTIAGDFEWEILDS